jgi:hypothetical protein
MSVGSDTSDTGNSNSGDSLTTTLATKFNTGQLLRLAFSLASRSETSLSFLSIKDHLTVALSSLVKLSMLFLLPQHLHVPQDSLTRVAVLICIDRSLGREFAGRVGRVGSSDWTWSEVWHGAVPAHVSEEFLDTHFDVES